VDGGIRRFFSGGSVQRQSIEKSMLYFSFGKIRLAFNVIDSFKNVSHVCGQKIRNVKETVP